MNHIDLTPWTSALWLCEPDRLQRAVVRARTHGRCYTREEILAAHRESLEMAKGLADGAVEGTGETERIEKVFEMAHSSEQTIALPRELTAEETAVLKAEWAKANSAIDSRSIEILKQGERIEAPRAIRAVKGKVGVIPIYGPVDQRMSLEVMIAGGTTTEFIGMALDSLLANPSVGAIVLRMDSPGGGVYGVGEIADKIFAARQEKPIYAIADSMAASAGYWIASAASMVIATPGADVGSIGVYRMHIDQSAVLEKEGVKITMASAGKYKTEFAPFGPLSEDARVEMQARVDETYDKFLNGLKRNRGTSIENIRENYGQGRVVSAEQALRMGMVDRILSYESFMKKLTGAETSSGYPAMNQVSAEVLLARHRLRKRKAETTRLCGGPGSGKPGPCPTGQTSKEKGSKAKKEPDVKVKAAQEKVNAVNSKVKEAKANLDKLKAEQKIAKAELKQAKSTVKAGPKAKVDNKKVNEKVAKLKDLKDRSSDPKTMPKGEIDKTVADLAKMSVADLTQVSREFGVSRPARSRTQMAREIGNRLRATAQAKLDNEI